MKIEIFENFGSGMELVAFGNDGEVVAMVYALEDNDISDAVKALAENHMAYLTWGDWYCYHADNVAEATIADRIDKYDDDGNPVDITEHPWTLQELYDDLWEYSDLIKVFEI